MSKLPQKVKDITRLDPESRSSAKKIMMSERNLSILEMRRSGSTLAELASLHGISVAAISQLISRMLIRNSYEGVETYRAELLDRLNSLWSVYYPKAMKGEIQALQSCIKIAQEQARLTGSHQSFSVSMQYIKSTSTVEIVPIQDTKKGKDYRLSVAPLLTPEFIEGKFMEGTKDDSQPPSG